MPRSVYSRLGQTTIAAPDNVARRHVVTGDETVQSVAMVEYPDLGYRAEVWRQLAEKNNLDDLDAIAAGDVWQVPAPQPVT